MVAYFENFVKLKVSGRPRVTLTLLLATTWGCHAEILSVMAQKMTSGLNFEVSAPKSPPNMINSPKLQTKLSPGHNFQAVNMKLIWKLKQHVLKAPTKFRTARLKIDAGTQLYNFTLIGLRGADSP